MNVYEIRRLSQLITVSSDDFIRYDKDGFRVKSTVDQFAGMSFNVNENGFPENSLVSMMKATSLDEINMLSQRLNELPISDIGDISDKDAVAFVRPRSLYDVVDLDLAVKQNESYFETLKARAEMDSVKETQVVQSETNVSE